MNELASYECEPGRRTGGAALCNSCDRLSLCPQVLPENRLTSTPCTGGTLTAGYRGDNLRGWITVPGGTVYFLYDGIQPIMELNSSSHATAINAYGAAGLVSRHTNTGVSTFYAFDPARLRDVHPAGGHNQGSVAERLTSTGSVSSHFVYDAYRAYSGTASPANPFGYEAQAGYRSAQREDPEDFRDYTDNETGLIALAFRYYDPGTGRFLNRDPIGMLGGINIYGYVRNAPSGGVDAWGLLQLRLGLSGGLDFVAVGGWGDAYGVIDIRGWNPLKWHVGSGWHLGYGSGAGLFGGIGFGGSVSTEPLVEGNDCGYAGGAEIGWGDGMFQGGQDLNEDRTSKDNTLPIPVAGLDIGTAIGVGAHSGRQIGEQHDNGTISDLLRGLWKTFF